MSLVLPMLLLSISSISLYATCILKVPCPLDGYTHARIRKDYVDPSTIRPIIFFHYPGGGKGIRDKSLVVYDRVCCGCPIQGIFETIIRRLSSWLGNVRLGQ